MAKKKKPFALGSDVEAALRQIVSINSEESLPENVSAQTPGPAEPQPTAAPVPTTADELLLAWYRAMKPRQMCKFIWMVLFRWQAARTGGVIVIDEFAALLGQKPENVRTALNELGKSGWLKTLSVEKGAHGKLVSKTIAIVAKKK
ncbi:MAG: hypothetical protein J6Z30_03635 [Pyramidobacter sp.]|nr:hypothetical protein [Pyramidobacter sp.]